MDRIGGETDSAIRGVGRHRVDSLLARATRRLSGNEASAPWWAGKNERPSEQQCTTHSASPLKVSHAARNDLAKPARSTLGAGLHSDRFDHLHVFSGEGELFSLEIFFHMLLVRSAGQGKHPDLHRKPKHDLCETGA